MNETKVEKVLCAKFGFKTTLGILFPRFVITISLNKGLLGLLVMCLFNYYHIHAF